MKTSTVRNPDRSSYIQLHEWQVGFCQNNHCAALVLAYFMSWHDWKLQNDKYYSRFNDIAEMHGDGRPHNENAYLFFTTEDLIDGCMGIYGKKAITEGIDLLVSLGVISVHKNPNPRYHFDKTKYFKFYPQACNNWIAENYPIEWDGEGNNTQVVDFNDRAKMADRKGENTLPSRKNGQPSGENSQAITDTTNYTTNKNKQINNPDDFTCFENKHSITHQTKPIVDLLIQKGMPADRLKSRDDLELLAKLIGQGATGSIISQAYDLSIKATAPRGGQFGVRYLAKAIQGLMSQVKKPRQSDSAEEYVYENDFKNAESWAGDLI